MVRQPEATCSPCASRYGRYVMGNDAIWVQGQCGVCGTRGIQVTNPWNIAGLKKHWVERSKLIPKHELPKAQLELF